MKRADTRYTNVWDAGYQAGLAEANRLLSRAIDHQVAFAAGSKWDADRVCIRMTDSGATTIMNAHREQIVEHLPIVERHLRSQVPA